MTVAMRARFLSWGLLWMMLAGGAALAQPVSSDELLEPEKAFRISARALDGRAAEVSFEIAEGYYMYRDRFRFATESGKVLADVELPRGERKHDEFFGETQIYRRQVSVRVPLTADEVAAGRVRLKVTSQGCADKRVCYAPLDQFVTVRLAALAPKAPARAR